MYAELKAEALKRITREVRKALPNYKEFGDSIEYMVMTDAEVECEIENLIRIILEEDDDI